jgi:8-oxo-dGTP diphosphatase
VFRWGVVFNNRTESLEVKEWMDNQDYIESLPKKRVAAGALIRNEAGDLLIVKPCYRDAWLIPGGVVEADESPKAGCLREVKEEIALDITVSKLLSFHYFSSAFDRIEGMVFLFDGGTLDERRIGQIRLQATELDRFRFVGLEQALPLLEQNLATQIRHSLLSSNGQNPVYMENGRILR